MDTNPICNECNEKLMDLLYEEDPHAVELLFQTQYADCSDCKESYSRLKTTRQMVQKHLVIEEPPAHLDRQIEQLLHEATPAIPPFSWNVLISWIRNPSLQAGFSFALVILVVGTLFFQNKNLLSPQKESYKSTPFTTQKEEPKETKKVSPTPKELVFQKEMLDSIELKKTNVSPPQARGTGSLNERFGDGKQDKGSLLRFDAPKKKRAKGIRIRKKKTKRHFLRKRAQNQKKNTVSLRNKPLGGSYGLTIPKKEENKKEEKRPTLPNDTKNQESSINDSTPKTSLPSKDKERFGKAKEKDSYKAPTSSDDHLSQQKKQSVSPNSFQSNQRRWRGKQASGSKQSELAGAMPQSKTQEKTPVLSAKTHKRFYILGVNAWKNKDKKRMNQMFLLYIQSSLPFEKKEARKTVIRFYLEKGLLLEAKEWIEQSIREDSVHSDEYQQFLPKEK